jgi:DNA invertase Pin-like site-specific DNA recombinase
MPLSPYKQGGAVRSWDVPYRRFSRKHQVRGSSEARQEQGFDDFNRLSGRPSASAQFCYWDRGESAYKENGHRTAEFGRLLKDAERKAWAPGSVVWVEDMDRFGRGKLRIVLNDWATITEAGYKIHVASLGRTFDADTPEMELIPVIMKAILAHDESVKKVGRLRTAWEMKRATAHEKKKPANGACPRWVTPVRQDGKVVSYVPNAGRVAVVKRIFALCIDGRGCRAIATILNREGVAPFGGRLWTESQVGRLLRNRSALGEYQPKQRDDKGGRVAVGNPVTGFYPRAVDDETFWRAQGMLNGRLNHNIRGREGFDTANLFTGLLWDAVTGSPVIYRNTTAGKYLNSESAVFGKAVACGFKYGIFEESFLMFVKNNLSLDTQDKGSKTAHREAIEAELTACESRLKRTQATMATTDDADVHASLAEVLAQQTKQLKSLQSQLDRAKADEQADPKEDLKVTKSVILAYYEALDWQEKLGGMMDAVKKEVPCDRVKEAKPLEAKLRAEHWGDFRAQLKNKLRALVSVVWVLVEAKGWRTKMATVEVHFKDDGVRAFTIHVDPAGDVTNTPIEVPDLKHYRFRNPPQRQEST